MMSYATKLAHMAGSSQSHLVPESITSTPIQPAPYANYVENLEAMHALYAEINDEEICPPSRPSSPTIQTHTDTLKSKIFEALSYARQNPASTKWTRVCKLVTMASTSRRYCGAADGVRIGEKIAVDHGNYEFVLPDTEEEWQKCEERWKKRFEMPSPVEGRASRFWQTGKDDQRPRTKADFVRDKVKAWQANVVPTTPELDDAPETNIASSSKGKEKEVESMPKRQSPLPFPVIKRAATASTGGKDSPAVSIGNKDSPIADQAVAGTSRSAPRSSPKPSVFDKPRSPIGIADLSEMVSMKASSP